LALAQAGFVKKALAGRYPGVESEIVPIRTRGDKLQDVALVKIGGKGVFVKEIEESLAAGEIDMAVHSMKDMPSELPEGLVIGAVPRREDPRDVLVSRGRKKLEELPKGARIGTGSMRRSMQLLHLLPDLDVVPLRGNLDTRLRKIETEDLDGIVVAAAGMRRLGLAGEITQYISVEWMIPPAGQGALGIEIRVDDEKTRDRIAFLHHEDTAAEVFAERAFLARMGGGCQVPMAVHARKQGDRLVLLGLLGSVDGRVVITESDRGDYRQGPEMGRDLAEKILSRGGQGILDMFYRGRGT